MAEMLFVARSKFLPRVCVALAAEMLERERRGDAAELRAHLIVGAAREALHESAAIRVAHARRIDDLARRHRRHVHARVAADDGRPVLASRDDEDFRLIENLALAPPGFLPQQLELVVV